MRLRALLVLFSCLLTTAVAAVDAPPADAGRSFTLERPRIKTDTAVLRGRAAARARVRIVRRVDDGWVRVASARADRRGRYRIVVPRPGRVRWTVRAVSEGLRTRHRSVPPTGATTAAPLPVDVPDADACGARPQKADGSWWECTFVDEFGGDTIDPTRWVAQETAFSGMTNGSACYVKSPSTLSVADGALRLSAVKLAQSFTCASPLGSFTTNRAAAAVTTKGRFSQAYGRFEARLKMADTRVQGAHSAFWLFPDARKYGAWPLSGEIDVAEWYSSLPGQVFPSVHYVDGDRNVHTGQDGFVDDASAFHTYAVEWTPRRMRFFYDGRLTFEHSWTALAPLLGSQPFDQPFNVVLTQAWGGLWNAPTAETPDRVTMTVDWVRVWK
jgi:beta-glucanase (GH16 family)